MKSQPENVLRRIRINSIILRQSYHGKPPMSSGVAFGSTTMDLPFGELKTTPNPHYQPPPKLFCYISLKWVYLRRFGREAQKW